MGPMAFDYLVRRVRVLARPISLLPIVLLPIIILIATVASAQAQATLWVTSAADSGAGSLRQALADAAPGDTVRVGPELSFRTITLASPLVVDKNLCGLSASRMAGSKPATAAPS